MKILLFKEEMAKKVIKDHLIDNDLYLSTLERIKRHLNPPLRSQIHIALLQLYHRNQAHLESFDSHHRYPH